MYKVYVKDFLGNKKVIDSKPGKNLRELLIDNNLSPYTSFTKSLNCGGNGICATCGVLVKETIPPNHWHDKLASQFSYPRLSCQIIVNQDIHVFIPSKTIWGKRGNYPIT